MKNFAHGLGELAGEDVRRWREDRAAAEIGAVTPGWFRTHVKWVSDRISARMADERCRGAFADAEGLCPVPISDPGSNHVPRRPRHPT